LILDFGLLADFLVTRWSWLPKWQAMLKLTFPTHKIQIAYMCALLLLYCTLCTGQGISSQWTYYLIKLLSHSNEAASSTSYLSSTWLRFYLWWFCDGSLVSISYVGSYGITASVFITQCTLVSWWWTRSPSPAKITPKNSLSYGYLHCVYVQWIRIELNSSWEACHSAQQHKY